MTAAVEALDALATGSPELLPLVLLVDDEPNVLAGLTLHLRRRFRVVTATDPAVALEQLRDSLEPSVIISDMNMPGIKGSTFLAAARTLRPDSVRVLLTGQANINSAIDAINEGAVFRFLTKPCPPVLLIATIDTCVRQHQLQTSERVLLQQTLTGSVEALVEVLSLANPVSFGWALRLRDLASGLARNLQIEDTWELEIASMLSQMGHIALPADVAQKEYFGYALNDDEQAMVARTPAMTDHLLAHIPRLAGVRAIICRLGKLAEAQHPLRDDAEEHIRRNSQLLDLSRRFLQLEARGESAASAVASLRARTGYYTNAQLDALQQLQCADVEVVLIQHISLGNLQPGHVLAADLLLATGQLFAPRGYKVSPSFVERCRNVQAGMVIEPVQVYPLGG